MKKEEYEKADLIISTHNHFDHFDKKIIQKLKKKGIVVVCTEESEDEVAGDLEARVIEPNRSVKVKNRRIKGVYAYNIDKYREPDTPYRPKGFWTAVIFELDGRKFYHMSDTDNIPELSNLESDIEVAFVPIGGTYTMDQEEAVETVKEFKPSKVVPIHFGQVEGTEAEVEKFKRSIKLETDSKPVVL